MQLEQAGNVMTDMVMYLGEMEGPNGPLAGTLEVSEDVFTAEDGTRFVASFTVQHLASLQMHAFLSSVDSVAWQIFDD